MLTKGMLCEHRSSLFSFAIATLLFLLFLLLFATDKSYALPPEAFIIQSVRTMSMGGAFTSVADDDSLIFYNPAGLSLLQDSRLRMLGFKANFNSDALKNLSTLTSAHSEASSPDKWHNIQNSVSELQALNPYFNFSGPIQFVYIRPHWGFTLLNSEFSAKTEADLEPRHNQQISVIRLSAEEDIMACISYGRKVYKSTHVGANLKYATRFRIVAQDIEDIAKSNENATLITERGIGFDIGVIYELPIFPLRAGVAIRDLTGTSLGASERQIGGFEKISKPEPRKIDPNLNLGISYYPDFKIPYKRFAYLPENIIIAADIFDGLSLGTEIKVFRWLALRVGIHKGLQLGIGLNSKSVLLDYMYSTGGKDRRFDQDIGPNHGVSLMVSY